MEEEEGQLEEQEEAPVCSGTVSSRLQQALEKIGLWEDELGPEPLCGDSFVNAIQDDFHALPPGGHYEDLEDHGSLVGSELEASDEDTSQNGAAPQRCENVLPRQEHQVELFALHHRASSLPLLNCSEEPTSSPSIMDEVLPEIDSPNSARSSPGPESCLHEASADTVFLKAHCGQSRIPVKMRMKTSPKDLPLGSADQVGASALPPQSSFRTRTHPFRQKRAPQDPVSQEEALFRTPDVPKPDLSKVKPKVRFPKDEYSPPKSRFPPRSPSVTPGPLLAFKSPADIVKDVLFPPAEDERCLTPDVQFIIPSEFRSRDQAIVLLEELQRENHLFRVKCAEKDNIIDQLRIEGRVNFTSDPPKPGLLLHAGLRTPLTVEIPRPDRAQFSCCPRPETSTETSNMFDRLFQAAQHFVHDMGEFEKSKAVQPKERCEMVRALSQQLDVLEKGYLLAKKEHSAQTLRLETTGSRFDPERVLERLIYGCGKHMEELSERFCPVSLTPPTAPSAAYPHPSSSSGDRGPHGTSAEDCPSVTVRLHTLPQREAQNDVIEQIEKKDCLENDCDFVKEDKQEKKDNFDHKRETKRLILRLSQRREALRDWVRANQAANLTSSSTQAPAIQQAPPTIQQAPPPFHTPPPTIQQAPPTIQQAPPTIQQAPPPFHTPPPTIQQAPPPFHTPPPTIQQAPPTIQQAPPPFHTPPPTIQQAPPPFHTPPPTIQQAPHTIQQAPPTGMTTPALHQTAQQSPPIRRTTQISAPITHHAPPTSLTTPIQASSNQEALPLGLPSPSLYATRARPVLAPPFSPMESVQCPLVHSSSDRNQSSAHESMFDEPLNQGGADQPDSSELHRSIKVLLNLEPLVCGCSHGSVMMAHPETGYDEYRKMSRAFEQTTHPSGREADSSALPSESALRSRRPHSPFSQSTSEVGLPSRGGASALAERLMRGPRRKGSEEGQSPSSSLSSLRDAAESEGRKRLCGRRRGSCQEGVMSPETDSGFQGSEGLTPAAVTSPVHQREPPSGSGVPLDPAPRPGLSGRHQNRRSRGGERRRTSSASHSQRFKASPPQRAADEEDDRSGHDRRHRTSPSEDVQSGPSSISAPSSSHRGDFCADVRGAVQSEQLELLKAEVRGLKHNMDNFVRSRDGAGGRQPGSPAPVCRFDRLRGQQETLRLEEDAISLKSQTGPRKSLSSRTSQTVHYFPARVSRPTQTYPDHSAHARKGSEGNSSKSDTDCLHCPLCRPTQSDCCDARVTHTASSDRPVHCVHVCPPPVLLYSPHNRSPPKNKDPLGPRHSSPTEEYTSLDSSLKKALRAASFMKYTSRHMVHTLASGLQHHPTQ